MKWEFKTLTWKPAVPCRPGEIKTVPKSVLAAAGKGGWQMAGVTQVDGTYQVFFQRPTGEDVPDTKAAVGKGSRRPENGPMQFGKDWPGLFIRGDSAFGYSQSIRTILDLTEMELSEETETDRVMSRAVLKDLLEILKQTMVKNGKDPDGVQVMLPFGRAKLQKS